MITLSVLAMIAALLPVAAVMATAQEAGAAPQIAAPAGKTAVRQTDALSVSGDAGGRADGPVTADLVGLGANGVELFRDPVAANDVTVRSGKFTGSVTLGCRFGKPGPNRCSEDTTEIVGAALQVADAPLSNVVRVDYTDPELLRYELIDARHVRVVFSEPVRMPPNTVGQRVEAPSDWAVDGAKPATISDPKASSCQYPDAGMTTGCTRILELTPENAQSEDATPYSQYQPGVVERLSPVFQDYANNSLAIVPAENSNALDLIRPSAPTIAQIDGKRPSNGQVASFSNAPTVSLTGMTENHTVELSIRRGTQPSTMVVGGPVGPTASSTDVQVAPPLPADALYDMQAVAIDVHGNRSDDDAKAAPRADGASRASYVLDRVAPTVLAATLTTTRSVEVAISEPIFPGGNAGRWFVGDVPVQAEGTGDRRRLVSTVDLINPGHVRWEPAADAAPGSVGRYGDRAGNGVDAVAGVPLADLPAIAAPTVKSPVQTRYTKAGTVTISGTGPTGPNLAADLFERGVEDRIATVPVSGGAWSFSQPLAADKRYQYQVRLRHTQTGSISRRVPVADIVRDTTAPKVDVTAPVALVGSAGEYAEGDGITVRWTASDPANDTIRPDHGKTVAIIAEYEDGVRRLVGATEHQPAQEQSFTYEVTKSDVLNHTTVTFDVLVTDLAGNRGMDASSVLEFLKPVVGYAAVRVAPQTIEAVFPVLLSGTTNPAEWLVGDTPVAAAQKTERNDVTVIRLTVASAQVVLDSNLTPSVQYRPPADPLSVDTLRSADAQQRPVTPNARTAVDRIAPKLTVDTPDTAPVVDQRWVVFTGTTDASSRPNTVAAYRADARGGRIGSAIATKKAGADGTWSMAVPLTPNALNRVVVRASDPSSNVSDTLPGSPYTVVEDSKAPVVRTLSPGNGATVGPQTSIRWSSIEAHRGFARLQYRLRTASRWTTIASQTSDDGFYRWATPKGLAGRVFHIRVTSVDRTGKSDTLARLGLRTDFVRPEMRFARSVSPTRVRVVFTEAVRSTRARDFAVDGRAVRRIEGSGTIRTLVLYRAMTRTTPIVSYDGGTTTDRYGNVMRDAQRQALRGFVFPVTNFDATRTSARSVRLTWDDTRNRAAHMRGYRIYRDGRLIAQVGWSVRSFRDSVHGAHSYGIRAVDDQGRLSYVRGDRIR